LYNIHHQTKDEKQKAFSSFVPSALGEIRRATVDGL